MQVMADPLRLGQSFDLRRKIRGLAMSIDEQVRFHTERAEAEFDRSRAAALPVAAKSHLGLANLHRMRAMMLRGPANTN
jgi:hypothetical protein